MGTCKVASFSRTKSMRLSIAYYGRDFINEEHEASYWRTIGSLNRCYFYESNKWTHERIRNALKQRWKTNDIDIKLTKIGRQMYLKILRIQGEKKTDMDYIIKHLNEWNVDDNMDARIRYHQSDDLPAFVYLNVHSYDLDKEKVSYTKNDIDNTDDN